MYDGHGLSSEIVFLSDEDLSFLFSPFTCGIKYKNKKLYFEVMK